MTPYYESERGKLYHGDCLEVMREFEAKSIGAMLTDPPYGLSFMGAEWDYDVPSVEIWRECLRILKPGAHTLIFAGSRTQHRMAVNVEDAGFVLKDTLMWLYGCLSEDTEILTSEGWKHYHKTIASDLVLCYDKALNEFVFDKPTNSFCYENQHTAYRIKSNFTDQIVSTNHRCLIEREGKLVFQRAQELQPKENIPFLDSLRDLPEAIPCLQSNSVIKKKDLLQKMQFDKSFIKIKRQAKKEKISRGAQAHKTYLLRLWKRILQSHLPSKKGKKVSLFKKMQWYCSWQRMGQTWIQRKRGANKRKLYQRGSKNDWLQKSSMEGRRHLSTAKRKLCESINKICSLSARFLDYGQERRLCYGASAFSGSTDRKATETGRGRSPYQSQRGRQQAEKFNAFREQSSPQEIRRRPGYKTTLATITPIEYKGKIWCVQVSAGAFVARRKGKIFITGNSGFPKALDISKAIDKEAGKEREIIGKHPQPASNKPGGNSLNMSKIGMPEFADITAPATPEAEAWNGWGTHLKPAYEPILLAMKPNDGSYAQNALKHGVAGLNIEECKISVDKNDNIYAKNPHTKNKGENNIYNKFQGVKEDYNPNKGRYPANVMLDEEAARLLDRQSGVLKSGARNESFKPHKLQDQIFKNIGGGISEASQGGASRFFFCAKASAKDRGRGNNHATVKPTKLIEYLLTLLSYPEDIVTVDPFGGSGTMAVSCERLRRKWIICEQDESNCEIAARRIEEVAAQMSY